MSMFGFMGNAQRPMGGAAPMNWADTLSLIGAGLKDASPASQGGNLQAAQQMMFQRQMFQRQQQLLGQLPGLFGGQQAQAAGAQMAAPQAPAPMMGPGEDGAPVSGPLPPPQAPAPQPPAQTGPDYNRIAQAAPILKMMGIDVGSPADYLKLGQPDIAYDRGFGFNKKSGAAAGGFHPDLGQGVGMTPSGAQAIPGYADAQASIEGAKTGAQEQQKAAWDLVDVPMSNGSTVKLPRAIALPMLAQRAAAMGGAGSSSGGSAAGGTVPGVAAVLGQSQTPQAKAQAEATGKGMGERTVEQPQKIATLSDADRTTDFTVNTIHDILGETQDKSGKWMKTKGSQVNGWTSGPMGMTEEVPGSPAHNLKAKLDTVLAQTAVSELQKMRDESPTGGALGRVTQQEINMLAAMRGSIEQTQSPSQLEGSLRHHLDQLEKLSTIRNKLYADQYPNGQAPGSTQGQPAATSGRAPPQPGMVSKGYTFLGGDPHNPASWKKN